MLNSDAISGDSSQSTLIMETAPLYSLSIPSRIGNNTLHGGHHTAPNSTNVTPSLRILALNFVLSLTANNIICLLIIHNLFCFDRTNSLFEVSFNLLHLLNLSINF